MKLDSTTSLFPVYRIRQQFPLVESDSPTSLFYIYRYDSTTGTFTVPLVETDFTTSLCISVLLVAKVQVLMLK